jgi:hypothetical protein
MTVAALPERRAAPEKNLSGRNPHAQSLPEGSEIPQVSTAEPFPAAS